MGFEPSTLWLSWDQMKLKLKISLLNKSCGHVGMWKPGREMERMDVTEAVSKELLERFATNGTHLEAHSRETTWGVLGWPVLFQSLLEDSCEILPGLGSKMDLQCCGTCQRLLGLSTEMCLKRFRSVSTWEAGTRSKREFSVAGWNDRKTVSLEFVDICFNKQKYKWLLAGNQLRIYFLSRSHIFADLPSLGESSLSRGLHPERPLRSLKDVEGNPCSKKDHFDWERSVLKKCEIWCYEEWSTVWLTVYKSVYSFGLIRLEMSFWATPGNLLPRDQRNIGRLSFHQDRVCHWHSPGNYLPHGSHRKFISCHWSTWQEVCRLGRGMCRERRWLHYLHYLGLCLSELGSIFMCSGSESRCTLFGRLVDYHRSLWWNCNSRCSCRNWLRHPCQMGTTLLWHWDNYYKEAWDL